MYFFASLSCLLTLINFLTSILINLFFSIYRTSNRALNRSLSLHHINNFNRRMLRYHHKIHIRFKINHHRRHHNTCSSNLCHLMDLIAWVQDSIIRCHRRVMYHNQCTIINQHHILIHIHPHLMDHLNR